jgi:hypothetical protein
VGSTPTHPKSGRGGARPGMARHGKARQGIDERALVFPGSTPGRPKRGEVDIFCAMKVKLLDIYVV